MPHRAVHLVLLSAVLAAPALAQTVPDNPAIDAPGYLRAAIAASEVRGGRRIGEADFIRMSREPNTIVLDARSRELFEKLHVKGAVHLSFPDIAVATLEALIPDRGTRILIYCNNNFRGAEEPFPKKLAVASLNHSTWVALWSYGYRNVWELGPLVDIGASSLEFASGPN